MFREISDKKKKKAMTLAHFYQIKKHGSAVLGRGQGIFKDL